jgi:hypothetical protein
MSIDINKYKLQSRPRRMHGIEIKGIEFGMAYHTFRYATQEQVGDYVDLWKKRKEVTETLGQAYEDYCIEYSRKLNAPRWRMKHTEVGLRLWRDWKSEEDVLSSEMSKIRKEIRAQKWEAMGDELLVIWNSRAWDFKFVNHEGKRQYQQWSNRPVTGDLLMYISDETFGKRTKKDAKIYNFISSRSNSQWPISIPKGTSIIDAVVPMSMLKERK